MLTSIIKKTNAAIASEVFDFLSLKEMLLLFTLDTNIFDTSISYARYFNPSKTRTGLEIFNYWALFKAFAYRPVNQQERKLKCQLFDKIPKKILAISKKEMPQLCIKTSNELSNHLHLLNSKNMKSNESLYCYFKYFEDTTDFYFQLTGKLCPIKQNMLDFLQSDRFFKYALTFFLPIFYKIKLDKSSLTLNKNFCIHILNIKNLKLSKRLITAGMLQLTYLDIIQVGTDLMRKENEEIKNFSVPEFITSLLFFHIITMYLFIIVLPILNCLILIPPQVTESILGMMLAIMALLFFGAFYTFYTLLAGENLMPESFKPISSFLFSKVLEPCLKNQPFSTCAFLISLIRCMKANNTYPTQQDKENAQAQSWPPRLLAEFEEKTKKEYHSFEHYWFFQKTSSSPEKNAWVIKKVKS